MKAVLKHGYYWFIDYRPCRRWRRWTVCTASNVEQREWRRFTQGGAARLMRRLASRADRAAQKMKEAA
ncbi:MAG: hypothetical protein E6Q97_23310 [Desulfurellales bacterium]|nr:MAG: hypothetical protein E6Q97_23310 [Desulfurellales bacterium]